MKAVWRIVKMKTGKYFEGEHTSSIRINDNITNNQKLKQIHSILIF